MKARNYMLIVWFVISLMQGCSNIVYPDPAPEATEHLIEPPGGSAKEITSINWVNDDFSEAIESTNSAENVRLLIKTKGYIKGEQVTIVFDEKYTNDDGASYTIKKKIIGHVNEHGEVRFWIRGVGDSWSSGVVE